MWVWKVGDGAIQGIVGCLSHPWCAEHRGPADHCGSRIKHTVLLRMRCSTNPAQSLSLQKAPAAPGSVPCKHQVLHLLSHSSALWDSPPCPALILSTGSLSWQRWRFPRVQCTELRVFKDWVPDEMRNQVPSGRAAAGGFNTTMKLFFSKVHICLYFCCVVCVLRLAQEKLLCEQIQQNNLVAVKCVLFFGLHLGASPVNLPGHLHSFRK